MPILPQHWVSASLPNGSRDCTAVNCWHINEHESAAMWDLYLKSNEGIAIQSTYQKLAIRSRMTMTSTLDVLTILITTENSLAHQI